MRRAVCRNRRKRYVTRFYRTLLLCTYLTPQVAGWWPWTWDTHLCLLTSLPWPGHRKRSIIVFGLSLHLAGSSENIEPTISHALLEPFFVHYSSSPIPLLPCTVQTNVLRGNWIFHIQFVDIILNTFMNTWLPKTDKSMG